VFKRIFKKEKPRLWLGTVAVAPRNDLGRHLDEWSIFGRSDLDSSIRKTLENIFDLPSATNAEKPDSNDYALDIVVPKFQSGDAWGVSLGDIGFPLVWRPKLEIGSRLINLETGKTVYTATVKVKLTWRKYFARLFTLRGIIRFKPLFDSNDINQLLHEACIKLLHKLRKAV
jgi:hypothetical protein